MINKPTPFWEEQQIIFSLVSSTPWCIVRRHVMIFLEMKHPKYIASNKRKGCVKHMKQSIEIHTTCMRAWMPSQMITPPSKISLVNWLPTTPMEHCHWTFQTRLLVGITLWYGRINHKWWSSCKVQSKILPSHHARVRKPSNIPPIQTSSPARNEHYRYGMEMGTNRKKDEDFPGGGFACCNMNEFIHSFPLVTEGAGQTKETPAITSSYSRNKDAGKDKMFEGFRDNGFTRVRVGQQKTDFWDWDWETLVDDVMGTMPSWKSKSGTMDPSSYCSNLGDYKWRDMTIFNFRGTMRKWLKGLFNCGAAETEGT